MGGACDPESTAGPGLEARPNLNRKTPCSFQKAVRKALTVEMVQFCWCLGHAATIKHEFSFASYHWGTCKNLPIPGYSGH